MGDQVATIKSNFRKVKSNIKEAKLSAELAGILTIYDKVIDKINDHSTIPSTPGSPPKSMTGDLVEGTVYNPPEGNKGAEIGFKSPAQHAHLLEFGTPRMLPRPFFRRGFEEAQTSAQEAMKREFQRAMDRGTAHALGMETPGSQELGSRFHKLQSLDYFDIHVDFWRDADLIGYSLTQGGTEILNTGWKDTGLPGGVTFNDLLPNALDDAKQASGE